MKNSIFDVKIIIFLILMISVRTYAQSNKNFEEIFSKAREYAFSEKLDSARVLLNEILEAYPENHEVRVFLGRTYAWEEKFEKAREQIEQVLDDKKDYKSALQAIVDVELWSENHQRGLKWVNQALEYYPTDQDFLYKKSLFLKSLGRKKRASETINKLLKIDPSHRKAKELYQTLQSTRKPYQIKLYYNNDAFKQAENLFDFGLQESSRSSWNQLSLDLTRRFVSGPLTARINYASRFEQTGLQYLLESYPILRSGTYSYLGVGYSSAAIFPELSLGAEIFQSLPYSLEGSLGFRYMRFASDNVRVLTGSLGKYYQSYWFNIRTYISPRQKGFTTTLNFIIRRYLGHPENYLSLKLGQGVTPDNQVNQQEINYLQSIKLELGGKHRVNSRITLEWGLGYKNNENRENNFLTEYSTELGVYYMF